MNNIWRRLQGTRGLGWLLDNPLLVREVRRRMRGRIFSWSLIAYLLALGGVSIIIILSQYPLPTERRTTRELLQGVGRIGPALFAGMCVVEALIALFVAPMLTAGLATAEKENNTFEFLQVTTLNSATFVLGCLLTTASFLLLVFACTLPILGLTFVFGGVSMEQILAFNCLLFAISITIAAVGVANSTSFNRSRTVRGVSVTFLILLALFMIFGMGSMLRGASSFSPGSPSWIGIKQFLVIAVLIPSALTLLASISAARRLYEPNNRLLNYTQFTILYLLAVGGVAGFLIYNTSPLRFMTLDASDILACLIAFMWIGWLLFLIALLLFSSGQIERGDEIWRLRMRWVLFRRIDERLFLYGLYAMIWLLPPPLMAFGWSNASAFLGIYFAALPVMLVSLVFTWALIRLISIWSEERLRAAIVAVVVLVGLWGAAPLIGINLPELAEGLGLNRSAGAHFLGLLLRDVSPFYAVSAILNNRVIGGGVGAMDENLVQTFCYLAALTLILMIPLRSRRFRHRRPPSYEWRIETISARSNEGMLVSESRAADRQSKD